MTLSEQSDDFLIKEVKENASSEAFTEVCRRYEDLFFKICQKYATSLSACGIFLQDIFNEKNIIILHCIKTFNPDKKTKLSSWIGNYARYLCLNSMNEKRLLIPYPDAETQKRIEEQQICNEYFQPHANAEERSERIIEILTQIKDPRIKKIFEYRYLSSKKMIWQEIANLMETSSQTVMALHRKGITIIKNKISSQENDYCPIIKA